MTKAPPVPYICDDLAPLARPIDDLTPYPGNAKLHDVDVIAASLERSGQYRAAVVQAGTGHVLVGNGMLAAARQLGWRQLAVVAVDVDDATAREMVLMDNRSHERGGGYDDELLAALLEDAADAGGLAHTGWEASDLEALLAAIGEDAGGGTTEVSFTASTEPPADEDLWPEVAFRLAPASHNAWQSRVGEWPHPSDAMTALLKTSGWL